MSANPNVSTEYDRRAIGKLLRAAFTPEGLRRFCQDRLPLRPAGDDFGPNDGLNRLAEHLVIFCEKRGRFDTLLAEVEKANRTQYERLAPYRRPTLEPAPLDFETLPPPGPLPPGSRLPLARNALFTGRAESLKTLARALLGAEAGTGALITPAVQGLGGVGKSQLAVEFAYRYGRYFSGVHWLNAADPEALPAEVAACGRAMRLPHWPAAQPEQVACTLDAWQRGGAFDSAQDRPRLLILDNLEEVAAAREWLARLGGGPLRRLLTARRRRWPRDLGLAALPLKVFDPGESREFLGQYVQTAVEALDALAERLGRLPLALDLAGRYLDDCPGLSVGDYVAELEAAAGTLDHESMRNWDAGQGSATGHDLDLAATFALSWRRVQDPAARRLFGLAGHCAPNQPIPYELLQQAAGLDERTSRRALGRLVGLGLLDQDEADQPSIHPLLAEFAQAAGGSPGSQDAAAGPEQALPALAATLATLSYEALESGLPARLEPLRPHLERAAAAAQQAGLEKAGTLWNNLGSHRQAVADYAGARAAFQRALAIDEAAFGPEHPKVARDVNNLGRVLHDLGDLAGARVALQRALAILEKVLGPEHPNVTTAHNNLGLVLHDLGDLAGARAALQRALDIDEAALGPEHPEVATDVNNLGSVLQDLGDLAGARAAYQRALAIDEAAFGPEHPNVAIRVNNLGGVLRALGDLAGARAAYQRALAIFEKFLPPDHPSIRTVRGNLASLGAGG